MLMEYRILGLTKFTNYGILSKAKTRQLGLKICANYSNCVECRTPNGMDRCRYEFCTRDYRMPIVIGSPELHVTKYPPKGQG